MAALDWASSSSSATSIIGSSSYDVFLNCRGEDTRNHFTAFLNLFMKNKGINVFMDSEKLWIGEAIGPSLFRAIKGFKISIPIFSKGYANSKWCLWELVQIVQCHRSNGQKVLPIFYRIDPSHVWHQTGSFEEAFREHEKNFERHIIESWREALRVVGELKGEVIDHTEDQAKLVELLVQRVLGELVSSTRLAECKYSIGMESRVNDLLYLLNVGSENVQFVGICGFGGIGKTTIAKAVYNHILANFDRHYYGITNYHSGKEFILQRLCKEKVLVVLDDVEKREQVDALAGELNRFGQGSRVILTTRDKHILNFAEVDRDKIYRPQELYLWRIAFDSRGYWVLPVGHKQQRSVGKYITKIERNSSRRCPEKEATIISFWEACGYYPKSAIDRLIKRSLLRFEEYAGEYGEYHLKMHDQIQDMGREIVLEENRMEPEELPENISKLSTLKELNLRECTSLQKLPEAIGDLNSLVELDLRGTQIEELPDNISKLSSLKELDLSECSSLEKLPESIGDLNSLVKLDLHGTQIEELPDNISKLGSLKELDLNECSSLEKLLESIGDLNSLVKLDLWETQIEELLDNISKLSSLKELNLTECLSLKNLFEYMGDLNSLVRLDLWGTQIEKLPDNISKLSSLKELNLNECLLLKKLPESISDLKSLVRLDLRGTQIKELPDNISKLSSLKELDLSECYSFKKLPESIGDLNFLVEHCSSLQKLPESIGDLNSLVKLDLWETKIEELPNSISKLSSLKKLIVGKCSTLKKLPESIGDLNSLVELELWGTQIEELQNSIFKLSSLKKLILRKCTSLKKLPESIGDLNSLIELDLQETQIEELPNNISKLSSLEELILIDCSSLKKLPKSISDLNSLVKLDLRGEQIEELPHIVFKLSSLKELIYMDCSSLKKLLESIGDLNSLVKLDL
ncbi:disease resistance protein RPV1-like [Macadamia integrifolia]|uniref:disease resistance protein RPV1-like n=1 Tax=Macadamia integrifolia TaxID=60698 RepID=UPI001C52CEAD|nr:disease resistance protein RPV1-like [Macadamia integrifolia]